MLGSPIGNLFTNLFLGIWIYVLILKPKHSKKTSILICIATSVICETLSLAFDIVFTSHLILIFANITLALVYAGVFLFILSDYDKHKMFFLFLIYITAWNLIGFASSIFTNTIIGTYSLNCCLIYAIMNTIMVHVYLKYLKEKIAKAIDIMSYNMTFVNFLCLYVIGMMVALMITDFFAGNVSTYTTIFFFISIPIIFFVFYFINKSFVKSVSSTELAQVDLRNTILKDFVESTNAQESANLQVKEGLKIILEHAKDNNTKAIIDVVSKFKLDYNLPYNLSMNESINQTLSAYYIVCKENDIEYNLSIQPIDNLLINKEDFNGIIANILDCCVKGCLTKNAERKIDLSIIQNGSKIYIKTSNSISSKIVYRNGLPTSSYFNDLAITSITKLARKYYGDYLFRNDKDAFYCNITLNNM